MTRDQINKYLASIISTLDEAGEAPAGVVYMALQHDGVSHGDFMLLQTLLVDGGVCTLESNVYRLTERGKTMAAQINAAMAA